MHAACAAQFAGSHMCHAAEYTRTVSSAPIPATGAWLDPSVSSTAAFVTSSAAAPYGRYLATNACLSWTSINAGNTGTYVMPDGSMNTSGTCNVGRPIACCL